METAINFKHVPVLLNEAVDALSIRPGGIYVDGTLGGGGHSAKILEKLGGSGRLIGIDQDINAIRAIKPQPGLEIMHDNFHDLPQILHAKDIHKVDGVLLDLGVSSHQLDTPERGFSYRLAGQLDMRMNQESSLTAYDIVNTYTQEQLTEMLFTYGEERHAKRIVRDIISSRQLAPIKTTLQLSEIIENAVPKRHYGIKGPHPATRSFMAIRIAVNNELHPLDDVLTRIISCLKPGGRISVITFHSLEDRIVKKCLNRLASPCTCPRDIPFCACKLLPVVKVVSKKPILPSPAELEQNSRAHSAKLRVGEKLDEKQPAP